MLVAILVVISLGVVMHELASILLPLIISLMLANIFTPIAVFFQKRKFPTFIGLLCVVLVFALVVAVLGFLLYASIASFVKGIALYQDKFTGMVTGMEYQLKNLLGMFGAKIEDIPWKDAIKFDSITSGLTSSLGTFLYFLENTFLVVLFMMFLLASTGQFSQKVRVAFAPSFADKIAGVIENIDNQVRQYLLAKTLINLMMGIITSLLVWFIGLDFPVMWGFIAFILNYIPNVGGTVATMIPFVFSLLQFDNWTQPILVLLLPFVAHIAIGNVIEPRIMAKQLDLSAVLILISLIFWGWLWGIGGMILAVPLTATIKIIFENIQTLHPLSVLMSGEVPLREDFVEELLGEEIPRKPETTD